MSQTDLLVSTNPATLKALGEVPASTPQYVQEAIGRARKAQPSWRTLGVAGRAKELKKLYDVFSLQEAHLAKLTADEMGMAVTRAKSSIQWALRQFQWNLENAEKSLAPEITFEDKEERHEVHYEPYGVAGVIVPWNFPLSNFVMGAVQALLAGNTVVYKVSEEVPLFGRALSEAWKKAGLPHDVFVQVYGRGNVGEEIARGSIDLLHFTGSSAVGRKLYQIAAEKFIPVTLELGGSDAGIVFEDADIDAMAEPIFWAKFINSGQICCGLKRLFVHESRFEEMTQKLKKVVETKKVGNPAEEDTVLGPLAAVRQQQLLAEQVKDARQKGATVVLGGDIPSKMNGAFFEPTLLTNVTKDMRVYREEVFGPVLPVMAFKTEAEAVELANDTSYGLSAYVYTKDRARFERVATQLEAGSISHNGSDYSRPTNPFGGYKGSGMGKTGGKIGLQHCCRVKVVAIKK